MGVADVFSSPHNWCDRRCERCPIRAECPLHQQEQRDRGVEDAQSDDPDVKGARTGRNLERAVHRLKIVAEEEGIDLDAPLSPRPVLLEAKRLERAGRTLGRSSVAHAGNLSFACFKVATKAGRIAAALERATSLDDAAAEENWSFDVVPNLLLLEHQLPRAREELQEQEAPDETWKALDDLARILEPLIDAVPPEPRRVLEHLVAEGAAPSPFCVVEPEAPTS